MLAKYYVHTYTAVYHIRLERWLLVRFPFGPPGFGPIAIKEIYPSTTEKQSHPSLISIFWGLFSHKCQTMKNAVHLSPQVTPWLRVPGEFAAKWRGAWITLKVSEAEREERENHFHILVLYLLLSSKRLGNQSKTCQDLKVGKGGTM